LARKVAIPARFTVFGETMGQLQKPLPANPQKNRNPSSTTTNKQWIIVVDVQTNSKITGKRTSKMESSADDPHTWAIRQGHDVQITALGHLSVLAPTNNHWVQTV
jgi:hypothetical protein